MSAKRSSKGREPTRHGARDLRLGIGNDTSLGRTPPSRSPWTIAIVTNGRCTEKQYFDSLKRSPWVSATAVRVYVQSGTPWDVVERCRRLKQDERHDEVWAVCDVDDFDVTLAVQEAAAGGIGLALSNPCFEVWLILHLAECGKHFEDARRVGDRLKQLLPVWDKTRLVFGHFEAGLADAEKRAQRLEAPPVGNPSTDVYRLVAALRNEH